MWIRNDEGDLVNAAGLVVELRAAPEPEDGDGETERLSWWLIASPPGRRAAKDPDAWECLVVLDSIGQGYNVLDEIERKLTEGAVVVNVLDIVDGLEQEDAAEVAAR